KKDNFKLIRYNVDGKARVQLFDLKADSLEQDNLADAPGYDDRVAELTLLLSDEMQRLGDFCDLSKPDWGFPHKLSFKDYIELRER
ncbi:MAG: sulfatase, partial [Tannerella sp.]|nr:sulfatase [Tannerella sp.]